MKTINPFSLEDLKSYEYLSSVQVEKYIASSFQAWNSWKSTEHSARKPFLFKLAGSLRKSSASLSELMSLEMGKPRKEALAEIEKCAVTAEYLAENFEAWLAPELVQGLSRGRSAWILSESLGPVFTIMPWNFPIWQVLRFAAPALAAGNCVLLKHADIVAGTAEALTEIFQKSLPDAELFLNLHINHEQAALVIGDPRVRAVSMTGSTRGGREVGACAGQNLKKCVLELGGNDPYLILPDADIDSAATLSAKGRMVNTGQSCVAAKRFFVPRRKMAQFSEKMAEYFSSLKTGPPIHEETTFGVIASEKLKNELLVQVDQLKSSGAKEIFRSSQKSSGCFVPAQILQVDLSLKSAHQIELFGPVALVFAYDDLDEVVAAANSSPYGLGAAVFGKDEEQCLSIARRLESGLIFVNDFVQSEARLPFGGVKDSGFGRELTHVGIREFVNFRSLVRNPL